VQQCGGCAGAAGVRPHLASPRQARSCSELTRRRPRRAFALEGRGIWHALSLSAAQQLAGPLRARANFRMALEQPAAPAEALTLPSPKAGARGGRGGAGGGAGAGAPRPHWQTLEVLAAAVRGLRATPLEAVYGLDLTLPGSGGAARAVAWWSPARREAQVELRLF